MKGGAKWLYRFGIAAIGCVTVGLICSLPRNISVYRASRLLLVGCEVWGVWGG